MSSAADHGKPLHWLRAISFRLTPSSGPTFVRRTGTCTCAASRCFKSPRFCAPIAVRHHISRTQWSWMLCGEGLGRGTCARSEGWERSSVSLSPIMANQGAMMSTKLLPTLAASMSVGSLVPELRPALQRAKAFDHAVLSLCIVLAWASSDRFIAVIRIRKLPITTRLSRLSSPGASLRAVSISSTTFCSSSCSSAQWSRRSLSFVMIWLIARALPLVCACVLSSEP